MNIMCNDQSSQLIFSSKKFQKLPFLLLNLICFLNDLKSQIRSCTNVIILEYFLYKPHLLSFSIKPSQVLGDQQDLGQHELGTLQNGWCVCVCVCVYPTPFHCILVSQLIVVVSYVVTIHMHLLTQQSPSALLIYLHCNDLQFVPSYL